MGCSPHPSWAVGTARGVAAPSGPQLEPLTSRCSPELLNIIKIQLLLLTATLQQRDKPPLQPRSAVRQELCSGPDPSLNTPWGNASPVTHCRGLLAPARVLTAPSSPGWRFGLCPQCPLNQLPRGFDAFIQKRAQSGYQGSNGCAGRQELLWNRRTAATATERQRGQN